MEIFYNWLWPEDWRGALGELALWGPIAAAAVAAWVGGWSAWKKRQGKKRNPSAGWSNGRKRGPR